MLLRLRKLKCVVDDLNNRNCVMIQFLGSLKGPGNPIANVRMNNRFAFLEFRSIEECSASMNLNNIPFMGSALNLARPAKFEGPPDVS